MEPFVIGARSNVLAPGTGIRCGRSGCSNGASSFRRCRACSAVVARCACESASRAADNHCADEPDDRPPWERE